MISAPAVNITQIEEEQDLDDYLPLNEEGVTQQKSLSELALDTLNVKFITSENTSLVPVSAEATNTPKENIEDQTLEENTEELFKKHDLQQHKYESDKPQKRVHFSDEDSDDDNVERKKFKQEPNEESAEEQQEDDANIFECNVSANGDSEDEGAGSEPIRNKSFTMEVLVYHLMQTKQLLIENKLEDVKIKIDFLLNKCQNRTSVRKRVEAKRAKKNLQGYVHVFCSKRAIGFYSNSYEKPKNILQMVHYITIKGAVKSDKTDKMSSANIVRDLKRVAGMYLYRANDTPKKHMNVFKNKLDKCIKLINRYVAENHLNVVYENSAWRSNLNDLPDVQSEVSE